MRMTLTDAITHRLFQGVVVFEQDAGRTFVRYDSIRVGREDKTISVSLLAKGVVIAALRTDALKFLDNDTLMVSNLEGRMEITMADDYDKQSRSNEI